MEQAPTPQTQHNLIGYYYDGSAPDLLSLCTNIKAQGYNFLMLDMHHDLKLQKDSNKKYLMIDALNLVDADYSGFVIAKSLDFIDESTQKNQTIEILIKEVEWAIHIGLESIYLPSLTNEMKEEDIINLAKIIKKLFLSFENSIKFVLPVYYHQDIQLWKKYQLLKHFVGLGKDIYLALILPEKIDKDQNIDVEQYFGELIESVIIPNTRFLKNKSGFPVLSKMDQSAVKSMINFNIKLIIKSKKDYKLLNNEETCPCLDYLKYLIRQVKKTQFVIEDGNQQYTFDNFASGYYDYLQTPLQPLMDHLQSSTYEVFEKDPIKYQLYEQAVYEALNDRNSKDKPTVIVVAGAGRGPLVDRCLKASVRSEMPIQLYALEKNPNAFITLQNRKKREWLNKVEIFFGDMREFRLPEKADILVSELLGSFGDNELSPECIDGAQELLKEDGISIPCSYTSYLAPITNTKLFNDISKFNDSKKFEIPYVVLFQKVRHLLDPSPLFSFHHPNKEIKENNKHNQRYEQLEFKFEKEAIVHGFAGYFEAKLYKDILCSIHPKTHSENMFSWFPMFFPIPQPIQVSKDSSFKLMIWRKSEQKFVWYEWAINMQNYNTHLCNFNGQAYAIGL